MIVDKQDSFFLVLQGYIAHAAHVAKINADYKACF
jgi:hypothetical protein